MDGYNGYFNCRDNARSGDVAVYVSESYQSIHIDNCGRNSEVCVVGVRVDDKWLNVIGL